MQLAYHVPLLQIAASNANWTSDWFPVVVGSKLRLMVAVTAITAAPAGNLFLEGETVLGDVVLFATLVCAAIGSATADIENAPHRVRVRLTQAGGANNLTLSADLIVSPPDVATT